MYLGLLKKIIIFTLDLTQCNPNNRAINPVIFYGDFEYLDQYPIENFR